MGGAKGAVGVAKVPVITNQPPAKVTARVGEELRLTLEVKGEEPIKYVHNYV